MEAGFLDFAANNLSKGSKRPGQAIVPSLAAGAVDGFS